MTLQEAQAELQRLRGYAEEGGLANFYDDVDALYWAVCNKHVKRCNCKDRYRDALIEIHQRLKIEAQKKTKDMAVNDTKARLVAGVVLQIDNNHYTNANITDEVARAFLDKFPMREDWFEVLPPKAEKKADNPAVEVEPKKANKHKKAKR